jgi:dephospho-CoA kinase
MKSRLNQKPIIVSFFGKMGSGKDTAGEFARKYFDFSQMSFGEELKRIVDHKYQSLLAAAPADEKAALRRRLLQREGQLSREIYPDVWVDCFDRLLIKKMEAAREWTEKVSRAFKVVVTDMRQPNEYEYLRSLGAIMIKIEAGKEERLQRIAARDGYVPDDSILNHETETWIDTFQFDHVVENRGTKEEFVEDLYSLFSYIEVQRELSL